VGLLDELAKGVASALSDLGVRRRRRALTVAGERGDLLLVTLLLRLISCR